MTGLLTQNFYMTLIMCKPDTNMEYYDFPEYGQQCELLTPWRGYRRGMIVGRNGYLFIIEVSSGARLELYDDEIEFD